MTSQRLSLLPRRAIWARILEQHPARHNLRAELLRAARLCNRAADLSRRRAKAARDSAVLVGFDRLVTPETGTSDAALSVLHPGPSIDS